MASEMTLPMPREVSRAERGDRIFVVGGKLLWRHVPVETAFGPAHDVVRLDLPVTVQSGIRSGIGCRQSQRLYQRLHFGIGDLRVRGEQHNPQQE